MTREDSMTKHEKALAAAIAAIGQREQPMGSNCGAYVQACQKASWLGGTGWPWCRAAVLKWRRDAGDKPGDLSAGSWDSFARAQKRGETLPPELWRDAIPGDEVTFNIGSGHSALLEKVTSIGGRVTVHTIDGNSGDMVRRCARSLDTVRGFICWPEQGVPAGAKRKRIQVVGSESGKRKLVVAGRSIPLPRTKDKVT
jgi:hypothetical protein